MQRMSVDKEKEGNTDEQQKIDISHKTNARAASHTGNGSAANPAKNAIIQELHLSVFAGTVRRSWRSCMDERFTTGLQP